MEGVGVVQSPKCHLDQPFLSNSQLIHSMILIGITRPCNIVPWSPYSQVSKCSNKPWQHGVRLKKSPKCQWLKVHSTTAAPVCLSCPIFSIPCQQSQTLLSNQVLDCSFQEPLVVHSQAGLSSHSDSFREL